MPVKRQKAKPPHSHPELVEAIVRELHSPAAQAAAGIPDIREEEQTYGGRLHVTVIWDRWAGVPLAERGPIILDAYRQARGERDMLMVTLPVGLTAEEARLLRSRRSAEGSDDDV